MASRFTRVLMLHRWSVRVNKLNFRILRGYRGQLGVSKCVKVILEHLKAFQDLRNSEGLYMFYKELLNVAILFRQFS